MRLRVLYLSGGMPTIVIRVFPCICIKEHNFFPNPTTEVLDIDEKQKVSVANNQVTNKQGRADCTCEPFFNQVVG